jgi:hypothetical protein
MSGEFKSFECPRCHGDGEVIGCSLWEDLEPCPRCDGTGEVYEYTPGPGEPTEEEIRDWWDEMWSAYYSSLVDR